MPKYEPYVFTFRAKKPHESYNLYRGNVMEALHVHLREFVEKSIKDNATKKKSRDGA